MSLLISYPCLGRASTNDRISNSALPFFHSPSGAVISIYGIATYSTLPGIPGQAISSEDSLLERTTRSAAPPSDPASTRAAPAQNSPPVQSPPAAKSPAPA